MAILDLITKPKTSYRELLNDPRWAKRAAEHRRVHNFCHSCRRTGIVIHVHHTVYDSRLPWEYADTELVSLCEDCHVQVHKLFLVFRSMASRHNATNMTALLGLIKLLLDKYPETVVVEKLSRLIQ